MSSSNDASWFRYGNRPAGPSWPMIASPCHSRRSSPMTSSSCAIVTRGTPMTSKSMSKPRPSPSVNRPSVRRCIVVPNGRGDEHVARVVVGRRGRDAERRAHRARRAAQRARVLRVEPLGDEDRPQADLLGPGHLGHQVPRRGRVPGQARRTPTRSAAPPGLLRRARRRSAHPTHPERAVVAGIEGSRALRTAARSRRMDPWQQSDDVVVLAYDGIQSLDLTGPVEVFDVATRHGITPPYRVEVIAPTAAPIVTTSGITITPSRAHRRRPQRPVDTFVVAGGDGVYPLLEDAGARRRGPPDRRSGPAGSRRSAPARSSWPRPACSTAGAVTTHWAPLPPPGPRRTRSSRSIPTRSSSGTATSTRPRA